VKRHYVAIPTAHRNGEQVERLGTEGVLSGDYADFRRFLQYRLNRNGTPGTLYHVYVGSDISRFDRRPIPYRVTRSL
jgi:hypothetical protein